MLRQGEPLGARNTAAPYVKGKAGRRDKQKVRQMGRDARALDEHEEEVAGRRTTDYPQAPKQRRPCVRRRNRSHHGGGSSRR